MCGGSAPTISRCWFLHNDASGPGGGVYLMVFNGVMEECVIAGNTLSISSWGGGLAFDHGGGIVRKCVITGNWGYDGGGVGFGGTAANALTGCTIAGNLGTHGGGIRAWNNPLQLENCIVWDNCAFLDGQEISTARAFFRCCAIDSADVDIWVSAEYDEDCIFTDPLFCDPYVCGCTLEGDWSLDASSPCLPEHSPCGELIGALGRGCGVVTPVGACCFPGGSCTVLAQQSCEAQGGLYIGDGTDCEPNPCPGTAVEMPTWGAMKALFREPAK